MCLWTTFSPDATVIASVVTERGTNLWSAADGTLLRTMPMSYSPWLEFDRTGNSFLTASDELSVARLWDIHDGRLIRTLVGHSGRVDVARFSPDHDLNVTASRDHTVRIWVATPGSSRWRFRSAPGW